MKPTTHVRSLSIVLALVLPAVACGSADPVDERTLAPSQATVEVAPPGTFGATNSASSAGLTGQAGLEPPETTPLLLLPSDEATSASSATQSPESTPAPDDGSTSESLSPNPRLDLSGLFRTEATLDLVVDGSNPAASPTVDPSPAPSSSPTASPQPAASPSPVANPVIGTPPSRQADGSSESLLSGADKSWAHHFGDDVFTWDSDRQVVILKVPVSSPAVDDLRFVTGHYDGTLADTPQTRSWLQQCVRHYTSVSRHGSDEVHGYQTSTGFHRCLSELLHLIELRAHYWWSPEGEACISEAVKDDPFDSEPSPRPLSVCPSMGYDPSDSRPLAELCASLVAAHPNLAVPTIDLRDTTKPLPSCWDDAIAVIEAHSRDTRLPDRPYDCYHAYLGYVWARQTGRESRPPNHPTVGCGYRANEATP